MCSVCSLDVLETARVAFGFGETICKSVLARDMAVGVIMLKRTRRVEHALDRATDAG